MADNPSKRWNCFMEQEQQTPNKFIEIKKNHLTSTTQAIRIFWEEASTSQKKQNIPIAINTQKKDSLAPHIPCSCAKSMSDRAKNAQNMTETSKTPPSGIKPTESGMNP